MLLDVGAPIAGTATAADLSEKGGAIWIQLPMNAGELNAEVSRPDPVNVDLNLLPELARSGVGRLHGDPGLSPDFNQYLVVEDGRWITFHVIPGTSQDEEQFISWFGRYSSWQRTC